MVKYVYLSLIFCSTLVAFQPVHLQAENIFPQFKDPFASPSGVGVDSVNVVFTFDDWPYFYLWSEAPRSRVTNKGISFVPVIDIPPLSFAFRVPARVYSFGARYHPMAKWPQTTAAFVFRDSLYFSCDTTMHFSVYEADHRLEFAGVDEKGRLLASGDSDLFLSIGVLENGSWRKQIKIGLTFGGRDIRVFRVSDLLPGMKIWSQHFEWTAGERNTIRAVNYPILNELTGDTTLSNDPSDFFEQYIKVKFPPASQSNRVTVRGAYSDDGFVTSSSGGVGHWWHVPSELWEGILYLTREQKNSMIRSTLGLRASAAATDAMSDSYLETLPFRLFNNQLGTFLGAEPAPATYLSSYGDTLVYGTSPIHANGLHLNNLNGIGRIGIYTTFYGPLNEVRTRDVMLSELILSDSTGSIIHTGPLADFDTLAVEPGCYRAQIRNHNYFVDGVQGSAVLKTSFDLTRPDANPPLLTSLRLVDLNGKQKVNISSRDKVTIQFSAADFYIEDEGSSQAGKRLVKYWPILPDSTQIYIKRDDEVQWTEISTVTVSEDTVALLNSEIEDVRKERGFAHFPAGYIYRAQINDLAGWEDTGLDLRIRVMDGSRNRLEWTLKPACVVRDPLTAVQESQPVTAKRYVLHQNHPNPFNAATAIKYSLHKSSHVEIKIIDLLGRQVRTLVAGEKSPGTHQVTWNGKDDQGNQAASGVYLYTLEAEGYTATRKLLLLR